ncbi:ATP-dependent Clp protease proteolytic subunit [Ancylobacter sp. 6x-1]|uniref:ATP-dependent Clp protease proteolytic subunit n=1 Tax=Ancylobacter crimeensis TaxID=2579147 RepID=A0ABT0DAC5_9HYPH|nr:head maturation protease, ClpP-related [Ancylobacter crimeensis]MCK0196898.1 ATP-dependent Clp protease proteolytic subunit [Ancylobacter crimeensis]
MQVAAQKLVADGALWLWGAIGTTDPYWPMIRAADVEAALAEMAGPVVVRLNSGGGSLGEGLKIWALLAQHPATVTIIIDRLAASAASIIAMAGDHVVMRAGAEMMIHRPRQVSMTSDKALQLIAAGVAYRADACASMALDIVAIYAARTGLHSETIEQLLDAAAVMSGREAVRLGFADEADVLAWQPSSLLPHQALCAGTALHGEIS